MSLLTMFDRAYRYATKSLEICRQLGDTWGQGNALNYYGVALYAASRYNDCMAKCQESIRLLERAGDYWQVHIARYQVASALYRLGDLRAALRECQKNYQSGLELGDEQTSGVILDVWARVTGGKVPKAILDQEYDRDRFDAQGTCHVLLVRSVFLIAEGRAQEAAEIARTRSTPLEPPAFTIPIRSLLGLGTSPHFD